MAQVTDSEESRRVAEQSRASSWQGESFLRDLFLGHMRPELLLPPDAPSQPGMDASEFDAFYHRLERFLWTEVDPVEIDESGLYPASVVEGLRDLGAFGMKIDPAYGGLGLSHRQYVRVMQLLGSYDANITALLSAHQAIGVPHPVQMFGSEDLKQRYLPRCARGAISAFALTEPAVGSDPARLATRARLNASGSHFILDGVKLWCTNGTLADVIVVLARNPETNRISCFVVEMDWPGVEVEARCHFMGLRALGNALISFRDVAVPRENVVGEEGDGLRIALATLNTGRLTLPAATAGAAKVALETCRKWSSARVQWGKPIGEHEAIAHELATMASTAYAMESIAFVVGDLADRQDRDLRLEAAAAKEWNTVRGWDLADRALQVRGGRGYETERSLAARGEPAIGIERMLRDSRINRIFEGSSEILHLFIAREAVDKHLQVAGDLVEPEVKIGAKLAQLPRVIAFYAVWYPRLWLAGLWSFARYRRYGDLGQHLRYAERTSRRLARAIFHAMIGHGPKLELKQGLLFRAVDVGLNLFALVAAVTRADIARGADSGADADGSVLLAERFARDTRRTCQRLLQDMRHNEDAHSYALGRAVLEDHHLWLERGTMGVPYRREELVPASAEEWMDHMRKTRASGPPEAAADEHTTTASKSAGNAG